MIVVDKPKLKFLLAGRTITVTVNSDRYRRGRTYAVGTAHNKASTCTATVLGIRVTDTGRELEIVQNRDPGDTYMARYSPKGYTRRLDDALGREDAPVLDEASQARYSKEARERDRARGQTEKRREHVRSLTIKIREAARRGDVEALAAARAELENVENEMRREAGVNPSAATG